MVVFMQVFELLESNVRFYCRSYPVIFNKAYDCFLEDEKGIKYIDFFSGAGALNYGHNHPKIKDALINYLKDDGICHSLDMATVAKKEFLYNFNKIILNPRNMDYKLQFCGPTGTNAVESAIKLARKITGRQDIITFTNAFHGVSLGSLSVTGSQSKRRAAGVSLNNAIFMPYENYFGTEIDTIQCINKYLSDSSSGVSAPAAFIVETIQAEGGINVASAGWLQKLQEIAKSYGSLLIIDDIQVGCGRTGKFFSFEDFNISPDLICLSKSLSAYGLPLSVVLIKREHDIWSPGEHNGTFRGNNLAFIAANEGLNFWKGNKFEESIMININLLEKMLYNITKNANGSIKLKGRGMIRGLEFQNNDSAKKIAAMCFDHGLIIETAGSKDQVIKFLPPLNIKNENLERGINILKESIAHQCNI
jgi:diaminobutyrate-2-oxoglutarate transaminase